MPNDKKQNVTTQLFCDFFLHWISADWKPKVLELTNQQGIITWDSNMVSEPSLEPSKVPTGEIVKISNMATHREAQFFLLVIKSRPH